MNSIKFIWKNLRNYPIPILLIVLLLILTPSFTFLNLPKEYDKSVFFLFSILTLTIVSFSIEIRNFSKTISVSIIDLALISWLFYILLNILITDSPLSVRLFDLGGLALLYISLRKIKTDQYGIILVAMVIAAVFQAIYGNLQLWGVLPANHAYFKMTGSFLNPGPFAGYLITVFPIILGFLIFKKPLIGDKDSNFSTYFLLISGFFILLAWIAAESRASYIGLVGGTALLLIKRYPLSELINRYTPQKRKVLLVASLMLFIGAGIYLFKMKSDSALGRLLIWRVSSKMIEENPLFGIGFDNFKSRYMEIQADYFRNNPNASESLFASDTCYAFNEYLQAITETGVIGELLIAAIIISILKSSNRDEEENITIAKAGIFSIAIFSLFSYPAQILPIKISLVCYLAWIAKMDRKVLVLNLLPHKYKYVLRLFPILFICIGFFGISRLFPFYDAYKKWGISYFYYSNGDYKECAKVCKMIYPLLKEEGDFLTYYGKTLTLGNENEEAIKILQRALSYYPNVIVYTALGDNYKSLNRFVEAEKAYLQACNMIPSRFYPIYKLAKLYDETGQLEKAVAVARTLINKKIKVKSKAVYEIREEMEKIIEKNNKVHWGTMGK